MEDPDMIQRPAPTPGVIDSFKTLSGDKSIIFKTLIGSLTDIEDPKRDPMSIPCIPGLSLHYWLLKAEEGELSSEELTKDNDKTIDTQKPHFQDEIYIVLDGVGEFKLGNDQPKDIKKGDIIFVPAKMEHKFITSKGSDLQLLIFFGPDYCGRDASKII